MGGETIRYAQSVDDPNMFRILLNIRVRVLEVLETIQRNVPPSATHESILCPQ